MTKAVTYDTCFTPNRRLTNASATAASDAELLDLASQLAIACGAIDASGDAIETAERAGDVAAVDDASTLQLDACEAFAHVEGRTPARLQPA